MSSTVTTAAVTTVSSAAMIGSLGLMLIVALIALLIKKEVVSSIDNPRVKTISKVLNVAIVPLMMAFTFVLTVQLAAVVS